MGKFERYLGKTSFKIDDEEIVLDFKVGDKLKLMNVQEAKGDKYPRMFELIKDVFKRSYPDEKEEAIDAFLMKKFEVVLPELFIALGLTTREEMEKSVKEYKVGFQKGKEE